MRLTVIEDEQDLAVLMALLAERVGWTTLTVVSEFERWTHPGMWTQHAANTDAAIVDYRLPGGISGCTIANAARAAGIPVVVLTAIPSEARDDPGCGGIPIWEKGPHMADHFLEMVRGLQAEGEDDGR
jgi:DNA-binding response OmpR family regulator